MWLLRGRESHTVNDLTAAVKLTYDCHLCQHPSVDHVDGKLHVLVSVLEVPDHVGNARQPSHSPHFLQHVSDTMNNK
jgi:hypothetical protein